MAVEKYIDYIDDPNDTYEEYLEKAKKYNFRCVFFDGEDLDSYQKGLEILKRNRYCFSRSNRLPGRCYVFRGKNERF